jgi:hypothetical protein
MRLAEPIPLHRAKLRASYRVTAAEPNVGAAVDRLWTPDLPRGFAAANKLRWFYRDNPAGDGAVLLLVHDAGAAPQVVGCAGVGPRSVNVAGSTFHAALLTDLSVEKPHRIGMPALVLQRAVRAHCRAAYAFSYGFPNAHAAGVYSRVGYRSVGKLTRYARVLRHAEYVRKRGLRPLAATAAGWVLDVPSRARAWARTAVLTSGLDVEWVTDADGRFDALWERARGRHPIVEERVAAALRWRFFNHPARSFDVAVLADREAGTIRAYVVIERSKGTAAIWDLFGESDADVRVLLDRSAAEMRARGAFVMSVYAVGPRMAELFRTSGFHAREAEKTLMVDVGDAAEAARATLLDPASWWVADGGEDV